MSAFGQVGDYRLNYDQSWLRLPQSTGLDPMRKFIVKPLIIG